MSGFWFVAVMVLGVGTAIAAAGVAGIRRELHGLLEDVDAVAALGGEVDHLTGAVAALARRVDAAGSREAAR